MPGTEEKQSLEADYDAAFDRAAAEIGAPPDAEAPEPRTREASEPAPSKLRAVTRDDVDDTGAESDSDPVAVRLQEKLAKEEQTAAQAKTFAEQRDIERVKKHRDFLDDVENNQALRQHILEFWNKGAGPAQRPAAEEPGEDDPLAEYDEKDRSALSRLLERHEQKLLAHFEQMFSPVRDQFAKSAADQEFATLREEAPDWEKWAKPEELKAVRGQFPGLSLTAAYRIVSQPKIRAQVQNADRQMAKVSDVLSRKAPAESQPRRHVKVDKREASWEDGFDKAYAQMKAAFGTPGR